MESFVKNIVVPMFFLAGSNVLAGDTAPWLIGELQPDWANQKPKRIIEVSYDPSLSSQENGVVLAGAMHRLVAGDRLEIGPGRYSIARKFNLDLNGTQGDPIWIVGADADHFPVITRPDSRQNVLNVGEFSQTKFLCLRHLEFTGGSTLIRFYDCHHLWLDQCHLHDSGGEGITTNSRDTSHFFVTDNHFHHFNAPGATAEAMYLGGNHGSAVMSYSVIARNQVHDCSGKQGDGIELKQGSHHNWIYGNRIHDTQYPCLIVYGTAGNGLNVVEKNMCYRSGDNVMQVQGEAIVFHNVLISGAGSGFSSTDHQGKTRNLAFIQNTIVSSRRGANLSSWGNRSGMVFANNAVYTQGGEAVRFPSGSKGVMVRGNVVLGDVSGIAGGYIRGNGLSDFLDVSWDGVRHNAEPSKSSALIGAASGIVGTLNSLSIDRPGILQNAGAPPVD